MNQFEIIIASICFVFWFYTTVVLVLERDTQKRKLKEFQHFLSMEVQRYQTIDSQTQSDRDCERLAKRIQNKFLGV